jgi:hypothetical protein
MTAKTNALNIQQHALSLAPAMQVALGESAVEVAATAIALETERVSEQGGKPTRNSPQSEQALNKNPLCSELPELVFDAASSDDASEAEAATGSTLTCPEGAELRLNWSALSWWLEQS